VDISRLPEPLRSRAEELERRPTMEKVRDFLGLLADMVSLNEVRSDLEAVAASSTFGLRRDLRALVELLATPQPPGVLSELVAWEADWMLDDPSDEGAEAFLRQIAGMLREVIDEAEQRRLGGGGGILDKVQPHGYTPEQVRDYEIAVDKINSVVGVYSARLHPVRDDPTASAPIRAEIDRWVEMRKSLRIGDHERMEEIRCAGEAISREAHGRSAP
jgi:hypothetical protein